MKKFVLFVLLIIAALHYTNPTFEDHKRSIGATLIQPITEATDPGWANDPVWKDLTYMDFFICSATQGISKQTLVSVGGVRFVKIVDTTWPHIKPKKKKEPY